ncbi:glycosyltransferase [Amycolatopsis anabasis]|uniref:glycosyltransferase n=1 Tax=Amycolatopsis anabasis TaxID=1840409 RepID=UPI00131A7C57|nr:glycosyltransferase [Amycolatopsis anabasis]
MTPIASVVIAAHNEEAVIERCLRTLTAGTAPDEIDVVVVANGCTDRTAALARAAGARVYETPVPGKANALVIGDRECRTFPRAYLDADVELDADSLRALVRALDTVPGLLACSPVPHYDLSAVSALAARFHRVVEQLLAGRRGLTGAGVYVLGEAGHARVFPLPSVISDDGYVHRGFTPEERAQVPGARSAVRPARTLGAVIRRRARVRLGNRELDRLGRRAGESALSPKDLAARVRRGEVPISDAAVFLGVLAAERLLSRWRDRHGSASIWAADPTSRTESRENR